MARSAVGGRGAWLFTAAAILLTVVGLFWPVVALLVLPGVLALFARAEPDRALA